MTRSFDTYIIVDWSARAAPSPDRPVKDAIWIGVAHAEGGAAAVSYHRTRHAAMAVLTARIESELDAGRRVLAGFDFPLGYPAGVAARITGAADALALWDWLANAIRDDADNANNRFEIAARINALYDGVGPFWGRPEGADHPLIPVRKSARSGSDHPTETRHAERAATGAKTVWQLMYAGSVGSQVLMGLPALHRLRREPRLAGAVQVWPFDTGLHAPTGGAVLVEIYPSLFAAAVKAARQHDEILDAAQVRVTADIYRAIDAEGRLARLFDGPALDDAARAVIAREEAWILGLGADLAAYGGRTGGMLQ